MRRPKIYRKPNYPVYRRLGKGWNDSHLPCKPVGGIDWILEPLVEARKYYEPGALYAIATADMALEIDAADGRLTTQEVGLASGRGPIECHE